MADSNIAGLPAGAAIIDTDLIAGSDAGSGTLVKKTALQFNAYTQNKLSNLPTTDPHILGMLWNNGGLVAISQPFTRALAGNTGSYALTGSAATVVATTWFGPTWSPTDHAFGLTVSGTNNQTVTAIAGGSGGGPSARSDIAQTAGQRYVEFLIGQPSGTGQISVGVGTGTQNLDYQLGTGPTPPYQDSIGYQSAGRTIYGFAFQTGPAPAYGDGDICGMLVDLDISTVKFNKNGGTFSSIYDISAMRPSANDPVFVMCTVFTPGDYVTLRNI